MTAAAAPETDTAEAYVSTDVETDGPIPGPHSMLSLASAAFVPGRGMVSSFTVNLETLPGAAGHPDTLRFWADNPQAWAASRKDPQAPETAIPRYADWLKALPGKPVFVGYPAAWDFSWVYWYLVRFTGDSPFSHAALDMKSLAMGLTGRPFRECTKRNFPLRWIPDRVHTHEALDDALEQGEMFMRMLEELPRPSRPRR
ncbi:MAG: exonuclease [Deltaproteobacteria bacterium]|nr:exonuclease [Deltaproteobacteria bacterium]